MTTRAALYADLCALDYCKVKPDAGRYYCRYHTNPAAEMGEHLTRRQRESEPVFSELVVPEKVGPYEHRCFVCGEPATHGGDDGADFCNRHNSKSESATSSRIEKK